MCFRGGHKGGLGIAPPPPPPPPPACMLKKALALNHTREAFMLRIVRYCVRISIKHKNCLKIVTGKLYKTVLRSSIFLLTIFKIIVETMLQSMQYME